MAEGPICVKKGGQTDGDIKLRACSYMGFSFKISILFVSSLLEEQLMLI